MSQFQAPIDDLRAHLAEQLSRQPQLKVCAFLDTRAEPGLIKEVLERDPAARLHLLYEGIANIEPSPALVQVSSLDSPFLSWLIDQEEAHHHAYCVLALSPLDVDKQLAHWQSVLFVRDPQDQETLAFTYYDPRALATYLMASTDAERAAILEPVDAVYLHGQDRYWLPFDNPSPTVMRGQVAKEAPWLRLRPEHLESADKQAALTFAAGVVVYLQEHSADAVAGLPGNAVLSMVMGGLQKARGYGLVDEASLVAFVQMQFDVAPNFDEQPAIQAALRAPDIAPQERLDYLMRQTSDADWEAAEAAYDSEAWEL